MAFVTPTTSGSDFSCPSRWCFFTPIYRRPVTATDGQARTTGYKALEIHLGLTISFTANSKSYRDNSLTTSTLQISLPSGPSPPRTRIGAQRPSKPSASDIPCLCRKSWNKETHWLTESGLVPPQRTIVEPWYLSPSKAILRLLPLGIFHTVIIEVFSNILIPT